MNTTDYINKVITTLKLLDIKKINKLTDIINTTTGTIYTCGNGGSSTTASHFTSDLISIGKKSICLTNNIPAITAIANDFDYSLIFKNQLDLFLTTNDILIVFSGSGNSTNILKSIATKLKNIPIIGITGFNGGELSKLVDLEINVPVTNMEISEDIHLLICHIIKTNLIGIK